MRIWIDATQPTSRLPFFGMTLLEYLLRVVLHSERQIEALESVGGTASELHHARERIDRLVGADSRPCEVRIELAPGEPEPRLPNDILAELPIRWSSSAGSLRDRLQKALVDADGDPVVALSADTVLDVRVVESLIWSGDGQAFIHDAHGIRGAALRLDAPLAEGGGRMPDLVEIAADALARGTTKAPVRRFDTEAFPDWIGKLRRTLPPYALRVTDTTSRDRIEHYLFRANYKGSTDFLTKYVYPPLVWALVKPLAERGVHPNTVTAIGIAATAASIPAFAAGQWIPGLLLAYTMSVLDSVDGKLARLTFRASPQGDVLDHGLDIIHPPLWYCAWAWGLSGGDAQSPLVMASGVMFLLYVFDRVMEMLFRASTGESIHGYRPIDVRMRTIISRRNVNLALFTVALPLGLGAPCFYLVVIWQAVSAAFHLSRVVEFWNVRRDASRRA